MARRTAPSNTGVAPRGEADEHGRKSIPGAAEWLTDRRSRKTTWGRNHFTHRTPNGVNDPFSFWHLIDALLNIDPSREFSARQLADYLNQRTPSLMWDPVTVGRILSDIVESCEMANGNPEAMPLAVRRTSSGVWYQTNNRPLGGRVLRNLLEDVERLCNKLVDYEAAGITPRRTESPLVSCASLGRAA